MRYVLLTWYILWNGINIDQEQKDWQSYICKAIYSFFLRQLKVLNARVTFATLDIYHKWTTIILTVCLGKANIDTK